MTKEEKIYKVYQLVHFFACKYGYRSFLIKNLAKPDEIWLINQRNSLYNIIRVSNYSLDDTYNDDNRIKQYIQMMSSARSTKLGLGSVMGRSWRSTPTTKQLLSDFSPESRMLFPT